MGAGKGITAGGGVIMAKKVYGLRGATCVPENTADAILAATENLLQEISVKNGLAAQDVISAFFTVTPDLNAAFPAAAARKFGWQQAALMCATEIPVPGSMESIVRVLIHAYLEKAPVHIYLGRATRLRPDLC